MVEDVSYTCETAAHFWLLHVLSRWEKFVIEVERRRTPESVQVCGLGWRVVYQDIAWCGCA